MEGKIDLRHTAERVADLGPAEALDSESLSGLAEMAVDPAVVTAVAEKVGSPEKAKEWLERLTRNARDAPRHPDDDHALLVGSLAALGALLADVRPEQATVAFEAVALA